MKIFDNLFFMKHIGYFIIYIFTITFILYLAAPAGPEVVVRDSKQLNHELSQAQAGTKIRIEPGVYNGGLYFKNLNGEPDKPIIISAADPKQPPIIDGGNESLHLSDVSYLEIHNIIISNNKYNGINIDDGGTYDTPSHHIILREIIVRDIGPNGNRDGIKLSGVDDFIIENFFIERWGNGGSAIDMVGCHRGVIKNCKFKYKNEVQANGVQAKGGSSNISILECYFENVGSRSVNIGGHTGLDFFRPSSQGFEAKDIKVERCVFIGSQAPIAFVGVNGASVRFNTIYRPKRWVIRILQESNSEGFVPCSNGAFTDNIITFRSDEINTIVNIGPNTEPKTFSFLRNFWYCIDNPTKSKPILPASEIDGIYGIDPLFRDAETGDLRLLPDSPAKMMGAFAN